MSPTFQTLLPILVVIIVIALRLRRMNTERELKPKWLWVVPALLVVLGAATFVLNPPDAFYLGLSLGALAFGSAIGWYRGKTIRVWRDEANGKLMQKSSPLGMILLVGIILIRFALRSALGIDAPGNEAKDAHALMVSDVFLAFAIGFLGATRIELMLRVNAMAESR